MNCNNCGNPISPEERFCGICGKPTVIEKSDKDIFKNCDICGAPIEPHEKSCSYCGTPVKTEEPDNKSKPNKFNKYILILIILALAFLTAITILFIVRGSTSTPIKGIFNTPSQTNSVCQSPASTDNEEELHALLDYSTIATIIPTYSKEINSFICTDTNDDGIPELFASTRPDSESCTNAVLSFGPLNNCQMTALSQTGVAGNSYISISDDNKIYMSYTYGTVGTNMHQLYEYDCGNWSQIAHLSSNYDLDEDGHVLETATFNGNSYSTKEEWEAEFDALGLEDCDNQIYDLHTNYFECDNPEEIVDGYEQYLYANACTDIYLKEGDFDKDGKTEYAFILPDFWSNWLDNISSLDSELWSLEETITENLSNTGDFIIYADTDKNGILFRTYHFNAYISDDDISELEWFVSCINNELLIKYRYTTQDDYTNMRAQSIFCLDACEVREYYDDNSIEELKSVTEKYINVFNATNRCECSVRFEDIADAPGKEIIMVASSNGEPVNIYIYTIKNGKLIQLMEDFLYTTAYYLTECEGKPALLAYSQTENLSYIDDYPVLDSVTYEYEIFRFDKSLQREHIDSQTSECYQTNADPETTALLQIVNKHINKGSVCADPYNITGYTVMRDSINTNDKYLNISNCSTNKNGSVNIKDEWLNFREGPGTNHDRILTNPSDPYSFVKQLKGAPLTVIYPENTSDTTYPVWVKIQIKYNQQTLEGYSSYKYITIPNIKHIKPNETFKVEAATNDTGLRWSSSDSSVIKINSKTGEITGVRSGLVLITVKSDSGLTDSCLIMVD